MPRPEIPTPRVALARGWRRMDRACPACGRYLLTADHRRGACPQCPDPPTPHARTATLHPSAQNP
jgi:hypothetical protein